jgi:hypothetical protein
MIKRLSQYDAERAQLGLFRAYDRFANSARTEYTIEHVRNIITWTFSAVPGAGERLSAELVDPWAHPELSYAITFELTNYLAPGNPHTGIAVTHLIPLVERLTAHLQAMRVQHGRDLAAFPEKDRNDSETSIKIVTEIAERTYFNTGTMVREPPGGFEDSGTITAEHYAIIRPLLAALARTPLPRTTYNVVKTLFGAIRVRPLDVLRLGTEAMRLGTAVGLANDSFAEGDIRKFLMRYITQYRALFESNREALTGLMDIVDSFAAAGWPQWIDVAFELDAIYRE